MVWGWSHTQEAYFNVADNVRHQTKEWLIEVYAEWHARLKHGDEQSFSEAKFNRAKKQAERISKRLGDDILAGFIIEKMEEQALCENGGHMAWTCPYGCGPHLLSFDSIAEAEERAREEAEEAEREAEWQAALREEPAADELLDEFLSGDEDG